ncbi:MAG: glycosyltransferase family 39 protein [Polyangiaceae bacterium]
MKNLQRGDRAVGLGVALSYFWWLFRTTKSLGFSRDESFYFHAAGSYAGWFKLLFAGKKEAFKQPIIDLYWNTNHEHPALVKSLFAISWMFLHEKWKWIEHPSLALRVPGMAFGALGVYITYLFGCRLHSRVAGLAAAFSLALIPSVFYHSHLACFDVPVMTMWAVALYAYWQATHSRTWLTAVWAGVAYGLLLETKHNAWMLPGVILPHAMWVYGRASQGLPKKKLVPWPLLSMATIGPAVFYALWPWIWNDTKARLNEYAAFHLNHEYYNIEYLGRNYYGPPSPPSYAPVLIGATVPTITLLLAFVGIVLAGRSWRVLLRPSPDESGRSVIDEVSGRLLVLLGMLVPIAVFFLPKTPIFGGTKHWLPAYPLLCVFAGLGFAAVASYLSAFIASKPAWKDGLAKHPSIAIAFLGALFFASPALETAHSHPFGLSTYVPTIGGTRGGANLGLNRQFWGFTTQSLAPYFAAHAKPGENVFIHDTTGGAWQALQNEGRMRSDLGGSIWTIQDTQWAFVHHEFHMIETETNIWTVYGTPTPAYVLTHDGVPIITLYKKPAK